MTQGGNIVVDLMKQMHNVNSGFIVIGRLVSSQAVRLRHIHTKFIQRNNWRQIVFTSNWLDVMWKHWRVGQIDKIYIHIEIWGEIMTASSIKLCRMHYCEFSELFGIRFQIGDKIGKILEYFYNHGQLWTTMDNHGHWTLDRVLWLQDFGRCNFKSSIAFETIDNSNCAPRFFITFIGVARLSDWNRPLAVFVLWLCLCSHTFISWSVYQIETIHRFALPRFFQNTLRAKSSSPRLVNTSKQRPHSKHAVNMTIIVHYLEAMRLLTHQTWP